MFESGPCGDRTYDLGLVDAAGFACPRSNSQRGGSGRHRVERRNGPAAVAPPSMTTLAGDVGGQGRSEEDRRVRDFARFTRTAHRNPLRCTCLGDPSDGVAIGPHETRFMLMPSRLYSAATDLARLAKPALAAP